MQLKDIIQRVQSLYSKGVQSDDSRLRSRHIYNKLITTRSRLISQKVNKKQSLSQWNYQTIACEDIIKAPIHECLCAPIVGCTVYRTKNKIPAPINAINKHLIQSVTSLDGSIIYSEVTWTEKKYKSGSKWTSNKPDYYIRDEYLYITTTTDKVPKAIAITMVAEDPVEIFTLLNCCEGGNPCESPLDMEFPIEGSLIDALITLTAEELIAIFNRSIEDLTNDTKNNIPEQTT